MKENDVVLRTVTKLVVFILLTFGDSTSSSLATITQVVAL